MRADILRAFYQIQSRKKMRFIGLRQTVKSKDKNLVQNVFGEHGIYDLDRSLIVVTGKPRLDTGKEIARAEESGILAKI